MLDWRDLPAGARGKFAVFVHELRVQLGERAQILVTVPPVRTLRALRTGAYDLRALARPARLLVLAWNEHGPRSEPGPVASLAFWKKTLRTVLRVAPRSRVLMGVPTWGWQWSAGAGAEQATQAQLFPRATETALQRPYGARVGTRAWVESDRSVQLKLLVARQAQDRGRGALGARRGVLRHVASALADALAVAGRALEGAQGIAAARRARRRLAAPAAVEHDDGAAHEPAREHAADAAEPRAPAAHATRR